MVGWIEGESVWGLQADWDELGVALDGGVAGWSGDGGYHELTCLVSSEVVGVSDDESGQYL